MHNDASLSHSFKVKGCGGGWLRSLKTFVFQNENHKYSIREKDHYRYTITANL